MSKERSQVIENARNYENNYRLMKFYHITKMIDAPSSVFPFPVQISFFDFRGLLVITIYPKCVDNGRELDYDSAALPFLQVL